MLEYYAIVQNMESEEFHIQKYKKTIDRETKSIRFIPVTDYSECGEFMDKKYSSNISNAFFCKAARDSAATNPELYSNSSSFLWICTSSGPNSPMSLITISLAPSTQSVPALLQYPDTNEIKHS